MTILIILMIIWTILRGGVTKKNSKIWDNVPIGGEGGKQKREMSQFQFGTFENSPHYFSKMSELEIALRHHPK